jgi:hypothetical protein
MDGFLWEYKEMPTIQNIAAGNAVTLPSAAQVPNGCQLNLPGIGAVTGTDIAKVYQAGPAGRTCTWKWGVVAPGPLTPPIPAGAALMDWSSNNCVHLPGNFKHKPNDNSPMPAGTTFTRPCS